MGEELQATIREEVKKAVTEALALKPATVGADEAAAYVGICIDTLYEECRKKRFPHTRLRGRLVFRLTAIDEWLSEQERINSSGFH